MNVYEKLNEARCKFQNGNYKKSGKNSFAGYTYYELSDILPVVNQLAKEIKFSCVISFGTDRAVLKFVDLEKPEDFIIFESPMSEASLKGCHAVQNMGAVETYIKRYLYQNCFEIVEADVLDMTMNPNEEIDKLIKDVQRLMDSSDWDDEQVTYVKKAIQNKDEKRLRGILGKINSKKTA